MEEEEEEDERGGFRTWVDACAQMTDFVERERKKRRALPSPPARPIVSLSLSKAAGYKRIIETLLFIHFFLFS